MESNVKTSCTEFEAEKSQMDTEKKARRSSILKPQKPRNPFTSLDFTEPNPDNTLGRAARRVSFASSNFVKPFAADPEKNTIWDNTYEEEVNHTDSTKSSHEQTEEVKSLDFLNSTSIYSPTTKNEFFQYVSPPQMINPCNDNPIARTMDSLISFARITNNKRVLETFSSNETIYSEASVKVVHSIEVEKHTDNQCINGISPISPLSGNDVTLTNDHIVMKNALEITASVNKENVNPIINDLSLVTPIESKLRRSSRLKDRGLEVAAAQEMPKPHIESYPEKEQTCLGQTTIFNHCDMELTESLSVMDIKENVTEKTASKTIYFFEENMDLTKPLNLKDKTRIDHQRQTINFNRSGGAMELTLPLSVERNVQGIDPKNEHLQLERGEAEMEMTALPIAVERSHEDGFGSKRKTLHFEQSDDDMEFTNILPVTNIKTPLPASDFVSLNQNYARCDPILADVENTGDTHSGQQTGQCNELEDDMEFTNVLPSTYIKETPLSIVGNLNDIKSTPNLVNEAKQKTIIFNQTDGNMELCGISKCEPDENIEIKHAKPPIENPIGVDEGFNSKTKRRTVYFDESEEDMEFTNVLPVTNIKETPLPILHGMNLPEHETCTPIFANKENVGCKNRISGKQKNILDHTEGNMEISGVSKFEPDTSLQINHVNQNAEMDCSPIKDVIARNEVINSNLKRRTVHFDESEGDMEFTNVLPVINVRQSQLPVEYNMNLKPIIDNKENFVPGNSNQQKSIVFNHTESNMELTGISKCANDTKLSHGNQNTETGCRDPPVENVISNGGTNTKLKRSTVYFDQSEGDMEFTAALPIIKSTHVQAEDVGIPPSLLRDNVIPVPNFNQSDADMEFTAALPIADIIKVKKCAIGSAHSKLDTQLEDRMEINERATTLTREASKFNKSEADMEFTTNLCATTKILRDQAKSEKDHITADLPAKLDKVKTGFDNQVKISFNAENIIDALPKVEATNELLMNTPPVLSNSNGDNKRHSNSKNDDDVVKKIKIDDVGLNHLDGNLKSSIAVDKNECEIVKPFDENSKVRKGAVPKKTGKRLQNTSPVKGNEIDVNRINSDIAVEQKIDLQPTKVSNSNILYSEPMKMKLKTHNSTPIPDLSANLNLPSLEDRLDLLNLAPVSTPATSFHMNFTNMSPCIEDTQQLLHATFSKPESLKMLLVGDGTKPPSKHSSDISYDKDSITSDGDSIEKLVYRRNENIITADQCGIRDTCVMRKTFELEERSLVLKGFTGTENTCDRMEFSKENCFSNSENPKTEKSCYIEDISLLALAPAELDELSLVENTNSATNEDVPVAPESATNVRDVSLSSESSSCADDRHNYTLRCQSVLANIEKHLVSYEVQKLDYTRLDRQIKQLQDNDLKLRRLITNFRFPKIPIIDLEEQHRRDMDDSSLRARDAIIIDDDKGAPSMAGLIAPKSLHERICEAAERCKRHWKFVKMKKDCFYFYTLFETLPFKVRVLPKVGTVHSVKAYSNLEAVAKPICWFELKLFQQKLKEENLSSVLSGKYDILTLLDYVSMTMEEITTCHTEYNYLVEKYGKSHHFRMNSDFSVIFEIISIEWVICWKISIQMSPTSSVTKDDVTATTITGEKVNEEHIKCIAENTPKGPNFLRNFIESVDEHVRKIKNRSKRRR